MASGTPLHGSEQTLTIAEVAERTGLSTDTLRYYEKAGLIDRIGRASGNRRRYAAADLDWLRFLLKLREPGMSIADMQHFAQLGAEVTLRTCQRFLTCCAAERADARLPAAVR